MADKIIEKIAWGVYYGSERIKYFWSPPEADVFIREKVLPLREPNKDVGFMPYKLIFCEEKWHVATASLENNDRIWRNILPGRDPSKEVCFTPTEHILYKGECYVTIDDDCIWGDN